MTNVYTGKEVDENWKQSEKSHDSDYRQEEHN